MVKYIQLLEYLIPPRPARARHEKRQVLISRKPRVLSSKRAEKNAEYKKSLEKN